MRHQMVVSHYYVVMPFGLKNSQATFVRMMDQCLRVIKDVDTYVEDIQRHRKNKMPTIRKVFVKLQRANLSTSRKANKTTVKYLGHTLGYGKVSRQEDKLIKIVNYPEPKNVRDIQKIVGVAGYHRRLSKFLGAY